MWSPDHTHCSIVADVLHNCTFYGVMWCHGNLTYLKFQLLHKQPHPHHLDQACNYRVPSVAIPTSPYCHWCEFDQEISLVCIDPKNLVMGLLAAHMRNILKYAKVTFRFNTECNLPIALWSSWLWFIIEDSCFRVTISCCFSITTK